MSNAAAVLNPFIAIVVDAMSAVDQEDPSQMRERVAIDHDELLPALQAQIAEMRRGQNGSA